LKSFDELLNLLQEGNPKWPAAALFHLKIIQDQMTTGDYFDIFKNSEVGDNTATSRYSSAW
jgi:hypothetical protein